MKYFLIVLFLIFAVSCEEDDICVEGKTPRLFVKFKNTGEEDSLRMDSIIVWRQYPGSNFQLYIAKPKNSLEDSILLPLPLNEVNQASFIISGRRLDPAQYDTLSLNYTRELDYSSKACGYKVNYLDMEYQLTDNFFEAAEKLDFNITDEETPHLLLYY